MFTLPNPSRCSFAENSNTLKNYILLLALVLLTAACAQQKPQSLTHLPYAEGAVFPRDYDPSVYDTLKVVSWNVEHFIDAHDNPYIDNRWENNPEKAGERYDLLAEALTKIDADIVVFQEFEGAPFAKWLAEEEFDELGYRFFADYESNNWYMNVVVISRVPLGVMQGYGNVFTPVIFTEDSVRKVQTQDYINTRMWTCDVWVSADYHFKLTGLHLKAGGGERNVAMRMGQINFLKGRFEAFRKANRAVNLLTVGDLNSYPNSEELTALQQGKRNARMIDPLHDSIYTHPADNPERRLDYILYNRNLQKEVIPGTVKVEVPFSNSKMREISDHLPVSVTIRTKN